MRHSGIHRIAFATATTLILSVTAAYAQISAVHSGARGAEVPAVITKEQKMQNPQYSQLVKFQQSLPVSSDKSQSGSTCLDSNMFSNLNIAIPDGDPTGVTNPQTVSGIGGTSLGFDVRLSRVCFKIQHGWTGDLFVSLTAPNGTTVVLIDRPGFPAQLSGCSGEDVDMCIELGTGNEAENVCNNLPAIAGNYTAFNGTDLNAINQAGGAPNGGWQLLVSDNDVLVTGSLLEWKLVFDAGPIPNWSSPASVCSTAPAINLNSLVTGSPGGTWSGSGVTGNNFNPSGLSGDIPVTYTVTDLSGCVSFQTNIINVVAGAPVASFSSASISLTGIFTNTSTGGDSYQWNFGDGNNSTDVNPVHIYTAAGTYTVTLTATNICGPNITTQQVVIVECPNVTADGSLEGGPGGGAWTEFSTNFSTPICNVNNCGLGNGSGPRTGDYWAYFGGIASFEEGSISQTFSIPLNSTADLNFWLEQSLCDGSSDFLKVAVDNDTVFAVNGAGPLCGQLGYTLQSVNLDAYADGNTHTLTFFSRVYGVNGFESNFFVDDISLNICTPIGISESGIDNHITISPVPASSYFDVNFSSLFAGIVTIDVSDIVGRKVYKASVNQVHGNHTHKINIDSWTKGVYVVKINADGKSAQRKIVVQ